MTKINPSRVLATTAVLLLGATASCVAQAQHGDAAMTYQWVHTNTQPGDCGCFGLNGGDLSASVHAFSRLSAVVDISGGYEGQISPTGNTLTLVSYTTGPRFSWYRPGSATHHPMELFAQVLVGGAHAGGGIAGAGDGTYAFATRAGAGLDLPISKRCSVRVIQAEYLLTDFANTTNNRQNNVSLSAGAVLHWSR